jgi:hypothetical protein
MESQVVSFDESGQPGQMYKKVMRSPEVAAGFLVDIITTSHTYVRWKRPWMHGTRTDRYTSEAPIGGSEGLISRRVTSPGYAPPMSLTSHP